MRFKFWYKEASQETLEETPRERFEKAKKAMEERWADLHKAEANPPTWGSKLMRIYDQLNKRIDEAIAVYHEAAKAYPEGYAEDLREREKADHELYTSIFEMMNRNVRTNPYLTEDEKKNSQIDNPAEFATQLDQKLKAEKAAGITPGQPGSLLKRFEDGLDQIKVKLR